MQDSHLALSFPKQQVILNNAPPLLMRTTIMMRLMYARVVCRVSDCQ